jgi:hypothetical protein
MFPALQDVFNLLPNLDVDAIIRAFTLQVHLHARFYSGFCVVLRNALPADQRHDARGVRDQRGV